MTRENEGCHQALIQEKDKVFRLVTRQTSYWFRVTSHGHLEHLHYGPLLPEAQDPRALGVKHTAEIGTAIEYDEADPLYNLDAMCLEWSGTGVGDFRDTPLHIGEPPASLLTEPREPGEPTEPREPTAPREPTETRGAVNESTAQYASSGITDFTYRGHTIHDGAMTSQTLPVALAPSSEEPDDHPPATGGAGTGSPNEGPRTDQVQTLAITLADEVAKLELILEYTVFHDTDVIARRATLRNTGDAPVTLSRIASMMIDLPNRDYRLLTLHGAWIKETHLEDRPLSHGILVNSSTTGISSNRHNPGFLLAERSATETHGRVYGFNLVYSGNHRGAVELSAHELARVSLGINPVGFTWILSPGEAFEAPQAVMTFSGVGIGQTSRNFHDFINHHIVRGDWRLRPRPIVYNNWEATFFKFTERGLLGLAEQAKDLGVEMFVLDDGWFGKRDSDRAALGDYSINRRKFPNGIAHFADKIRACGLRFGIWMEPEMISRDSDLYREHPDWAVTTPGRTPRLGRHQLVLDLTRAEVRDHIVEMVGRIIDETQADYVKWDFNRPLSDLYAPGLTSQGEFSHRYILGLYEILRRVFWTRPRVLLESCASGGNRFDLGMLCFSPQVWSSDDTDPIERLSIQGGLSLLYPPSTMGAHVSEAPHQQTLRHTPLTTRFNVAAFGCLGYELDLNMLSPVERREIREQIQFYKDHRETLQYGRHYRTDRDAGAKPNKVLWTMVAQDGSEAITGLFQTLAQASEGFDCLPVDGLDPDDPYTIRTRPQSLFIERFGGLVKHLGIPLNPEGPVMGLVKRHHRMTDCVEEYSAYGATLADGLLLSNQYMGTGYNPQTRLLSDFGSNLYLTTRTPN